MQKSKEYVVVNFLSQVIYIFLLFQLHYHTLPYPQTKEKQKLPEIKLTTKSIKTCSDLCTEPWSLVISINFLYVRHQNSSKWQLNQYHFMMNLFIVKRAGRALIRHQDDGYNSSLNKLPPFSKH